ncbi:hypothetical protein CLI64_02865 [Nostoc sp. CENA543]|nr:hypothetical protein CLI64_02865 [Nostoc sp. CENA543]
MWHKALTGQAKSQSGKTKNAEFVSSNVNPSYKLLNCFLLIKLKNLKSIHIEKPGQPVPGFSILQIFPLGNC